MHLVQSKPELTIQVAETSFVVCPASVKVNRAVQSLLYDCTPFTGCSLVAVNIKRDAIIWIDRVDTTDSFTDFVLISTVSIVVYGKESTHFNFFAAARFGL